jgi:hypothetical protein
MEAVGGDGTGVCRGQDHLKHGQHPGTDHGHDDEPGSAQAEEEQHIDGGDGEAGHGAHHGRHCATSGSAYDEQVSDARTAAPAPVGPGNLRQGGRVVFRARRPAALVIPLAAVTEVAGVLFLLNGATIGWFVCAAPAVALIVTGLILRPSLELTREGLLQRQYPFSSLTRWEVIDAMGITRAGNRMVLAYRLVAGILPPRRQPAASLLRAAQRPFDGGYFVDSLVGDPDHILATVEAYRASAELRAELPAARR